MMQEGRQGGIRCAKRLLYPLARPLSRVNCDADTHDDWAGTREAKWGSNEWVGEKEMLAQIRGVQ